MADTGSPTNKLYTKVGGLLAAVSQWLALDTGSEAGFTAATNALTSECAVSGLTRVAATVTNPTTTVAGDMWAYHTYAVQIDEEFELIASQGCPFHDRRLWPDPNAPERDESRAHLCNGPHPLVVYWNTKTNNMESRYERWRVKWCMANRLNKTPKGFREGTRKHYLFAILHGYKIFGGK